MIEINSLGVKRALDLLTERLEALPDDEYARLLGHRATVRSPNDHEIAKVLFAWGAVMNEKMTEAQANQVYDEILEELMPAGGAMSACPHGRYLEVEGCSTCEAEEERDVVLAALKNLVVGIDRACISGETLEECLPETVQDPYEAARALLGDPMVMYSGGQVDWHYHYMGENSEDCYWCEQHAEAGAA